MNRPAGVLGGRDPVLRMDEREKRSVLGQARALIDGKL